MSAASAPAKPAGVDELYEAVSGLESPLHDARAMAKIVSTLIEDRLVYRKEFGVSEVGDLGDAITWAVYHLEELILKAHAEWDGINTLAFDMKRVAR